MSRRTAFLTVAALAAVALLLMPQGRAVAQSTIRQVFVTNFPAVQRVEGEVSLAAPVRLSVLQRFDDLVVPPVQPTDTTRLVEAGVLVTEGFPNVVLSLHGQVKGSVLKRGDVGAILIPEQPTIEAAFNEHGMTHFALTVASRDVSSRTPYFASNQPRYTVGFNAYRVLLFNTTDKTVTASLFAYLTN